MTYHTGQRWVATPAQHVTDAVLEYKDDQKFIDRFWSKVNKDGECWIWTAALSSEGYGNFTVGKHTVRAHIVAWILTYGGRPDSLYLDHVFPVCSGRWCVNPEHLEAVTAKENTIRGTGIGSANQRAMRSEALLKRTKEAN